MYISILLCWTCLFSDGLWWATDWRLCNEAFEMAPSDSTPLFPLLSYLIFSTWRKGEAIRVVLLFTIFNSVLSSLRSFFVMSWKSTVLLFFFLFASCSSGSTVIVLWGGGAFFFFGLFETPLGSGVVLEDLDTDLSLKELALLLLLSVSSLGENTLSC